MLEAESLCDGLFITRGQDELTLKYVDIIKIMTRDSDEVFLSDNGKMTISIVPYDTEYTFFIPDGRIIHFIAEEWFDILGSAACIDPPFVYDEVCTECAEYVPDRLHHACPFTLSKLPIFTLTKFGQKVTKDLIDDVLTLYMSTINARTIDIKAIESALGKIKMATMLEKNFESRGKDIFWSEAHFRNFKVCLKDLVIITIIAKLEVLALL